MDISKLDKLDKDFFLFLNGIHHPFFDPVMLFFTHKWNWIPFYIFLIFLIIKKHKKKSFLLVPLIAVLIWASDRISSGLIKPFFERLRPCYSPDIQQFVRMVSDCGGQFGFVSSHAANTFAISMFLFLLFKENKYFRFMFLWAFLVSYSRIYLGVHYPGDIFFGALLGIILGLLMYKFYQFLYRHSS